MPSEASFPTSDLPEASARSADRPGGLPDGDALDVVIIGAARPG